MTNVLDFFMSETSSSVSRARVPGFRRISSSPKVARVIMSELRASSGYASFIVSIAAPTSLWRNGSLCRESCRGARRACYDAP